MKKLVKYLCLSQNFNTMNPSNVFLANIDFPTHLLSCPWLYVRHAVFSTTNRKFVNVDVRSLWLNWAQTNFFSNPLSWEMFRDGKESFCGNFEYLIDVVLCPKQQKVGKWHISTKRELGSSEAEKCRANAQKLHFRFLLTKETNPSPLVTSGKCLQKKCECQFDGLSQNGGRKKWLLKHVG